MNILNIISIVCLALCLLMFFYFKWEIKKRTTSPNRDERRDEYHRLIADIDRVTDRDLQLIEDRIVKLKAILEDADKRISVYVKELEKSRIEETLYSSLGKGIRDVFETNEENFPVDSIKISDTANALSSPSAAFQPSVQHSVQTNKISSWQTIMNEKIEEPPTKFSSVHPPAIEKEILDMSSPSRHQLRSHIDLMIDDGLPAEEIALRLGISIAEVNLAKNLRRR